LLLALVHLGLFAGGLLAVTAFAGGDRYPSPFGPESVAREFFSAHVESMRFNGFFHFASAIPLGLFTATAVSRLRFLRVRAAGELIALFGGFAASVALMVSGLCSWALGDPELVQSAGAARALHLVGFMFGGPAYVALFGLLVAGVSVTSGFRHLLPRWLVGFGVVIAIISELATLVMLLPAMVYLVPAARVLGLVWLIATALKLPTTLETGDAMRRERDGGTALPVELSAPHAPAR
jgi:hypothetical protein